MAGAILMAEGRKTEQTQNLLKRRTQHVHDFTDGSWSGCVVLPTAKDMSEASSRTSVYYDSTKGMHVFMCMLTTVPPCSRHVSLVVHMYVVASSKGISCPSPSQTHTCIEIGIVVAFPCCDSL